MSEQTLHLPVIQWTSHSRPCACFAAVSKFCYVHGYPSMMLLIHSMQLFLGEPAPAEAVSQQETNNCTAHLSFAVLVSAQFGKENRSTPPHLPLLLPDWRVLSFLCSCLSKGPTFNFLSVLIELSHVKSKPFLAAWHDKMPCPWEDSCLFYRTAPRCTLSLHLPRYPMPFVGILWSSHLS